MLDGAGQVHDVDAVLADELQVAGGELIAVLVQDRQVLPVLEARVQHAPALVHASL